MYFLVLTNGNGFCHSFGMKRKIVIVGPDGENLEEGVLKQVWCRSGRQPGYVLWAHQDPALVQKESAETWRIDALRPVYNDVQGIPWKFTWKQPLRRDVSGQLVNTFTYAGMMERMGYNYNPSLNDPLKLALDHYEDERKRMGRGTYQYHSLPRSAGAQLPET